MRVSRPISVTLPDYGVLFAESIHAGDFRMAERADPFDKLIYVLHGKVNYWEIGRPEPVEAKTGAMLVIPRAVAHRLIDREPSTLLLLCLNNHFLGTDADLGRLWQFLGRLPSRRLALSRPARQTLEGYWQRATVESSDARPGGPTVVRTLAAQTLILLARLPAESGGVSSLERVSAVVHEVDETFYEPWNVDRAATRSGLSRRRFTDLFRRVTGRPFQDYLNHQRLTHAARLLRQRGHSIMGVMFSCGFNDVSHFYRKFRNRYGAAPRAWSALTPIRHVFVDRELR